MEKLKDLIVKATIELDVQIALHKDPDEVEILQKMDTQLVTLLDNACLISDTKLLPEGTELLGEFVS